MISELHAAMNPWLVDATKQLLEMSDPNPSSRNTGQEAHIFAVSFRRIELKTKKLSKTTELTLVKGRSSSVMRSNLDDV